MVDVCYMHFNASLHLKTLILFTYSYSLYGKSWCSEHFVLKCFDFCMPCHELCFVQFDIISCFFVLYFRYNFQKQFDSSTETSCFSDGIHGQGYTTSISDLEQQKNKKLQLSNLNLKGQLCCQLFKQERCKVERLDSPLSRGDQTMACGSFNPACQIPCTLFSITAFPTVDSSATALAAARLLLTCLPQKHYKSVNKMM